MEEKVKEDNYPKTYEECPICKCSERVVEREVYEEKLLGRISPERIACSIQKVIPLKDPTRNALIFPVLMVHYDYCDRCGFEYAHIITKQKMTWDQVQTLIRQAMGLA